MIWKEEPFTPVGTDRVPDGSFPDDRLHRSVARVFVFGVRPDTNDVADAHDDAARPIAKGRSFGIEERETLLGLRRTEECVEHRKLIAPVLYPRLTKARQLVNTGLEFWEKPDRLVARYG